MPEGPRHTAEILVEFDEGIAAEDRTMWRARVLGAPNELRQWEGWIEFAPLAGAAGATDAASAIDAWLPTERETTQPHRADLAYWATGLTMVYLQGALRRARTRGAPRPAASAPAFVTSRGPAPHSPAMRPGAVRYAVLDPFAVYAQGEQVLRSELHALSVDHLRTIASSYSLDVGAGEGDLADRIVAAVKRETTSRPG